MQLLTDIDRKQGLLREAVSLVKNCNPQLASRLESCDEFDAGHVETLEAILYEYQSLSRVATQAQQLMDHQAQEYQQEGKVESFHANKFSFL
jgi:hypothetical protein